MATVQKGAKINFYKFVQVKEPSGGTAAAKTDSNIALTKSINANTKAINNLGATVNSLAKVVADIKKVQLAQLDASIRNTKTFQAEYTKPQKEKKSAGLFTAALAKSGSFLEGLLNMLGGLFKMAVVTPALQWLGDPKNQKKIEDGLNVLKTIGEFIWKWAEFGVTNSINGLYDLLKDDATWQERLTGFGKALVGIGAIVLGVRYLSNPTKLISDMYRGVRALIGFVTGRGGGRRPRTKGGGGLRTVLGLGTAAVAGYGLYQSFQEPEYAQGGKLPERSKGGWIRGPQSGYKVSLDGGRSTSFIGHGTEYVARKANGGAFVVPFNTPATSRQPHLTQKRISEAKSQGYKLPGFASGGQYLQDIKSNDATQGSNDNKKIFLHWSAGSRSATNFYNGYGYHTYIDSAGNPVRRAKFGSKGIPHHTYGRDKASSASIGLAGMATASEENRNSWGSEAITPNQYKGMAKEAAAIATNWGWKPADITDKRIRTHSEEYRDYPNWYRRHVPSDYRWDLNRLYPGDPKNTGGNKIRSMIKQEMSGFSGGSKSKDGHKDRPWNQWLGIADALTGNVFNLDGVPRSAPSPAPAPTKREVGRPDPGVKVEPLPANFSDKQAFMYIYNIARKVGGTKWPEVVAAQAMHETGYLKAPNSVYMASGKTNPFGQTGDRGWGTMPRAGSAVGWTKYPNVEEAVRDHIKMWHNVGNHPQNYNAFDNILDGIAAVAPAYSPNSDPANIRLGYTTDSYSRGMVSALKVGGFDPKTKRTGAAPAATPSTASRSGSTPSGASGAIGATGTAAERSSKIFLGEHSEAGFGKDIYSLGNLRSYRSRYGYNTATGIQPTEAQEIKKITEERNDARRQINERTREMMSAALEAVGQQNGANAQIVAQAQQRIQQISAQTAPPQPQFVPTQGAISGSAVGGAIGGSVGAAIGGTTAAVLNSFNNPLKGIFR